MVPERLAVGLVVAVEDIGVGPDLDVAAELLAGVVAVLVDLGLELAGILGFRRDETDVAILRGEAAAAIGTRRAHQRRPRALDRLRRQLGFFHLIEAAGKNARLWICPPPAR